MAIHTQETLTLPQGSKVYFASDFHLGIDARVSSREREQQIIAWLDHAARDAAAIYLVGDLFDFWFEYRHAVPRGFLRFQGKLAELRDRGIPLYIFTGNHDMWMFDYFEKELDLQILRRPVRREINGKTFFIAHGDGLGPGDHGYKFLKKVFANRTCQWLFARLHPNLGIGLANYWSGKSRSVNPEPPVFLGPEKEWLIQYAHRKLQDAHYDFFVFGHRHLPIDYTLQNGRSRYINMGEWLSFNSYAVFDGEDMEVRFFHFAPQTVHGSDPEKAVG